MFDGRVVEGFISKKDCEYLIDLAIRLDLWEGAGYKFWDNRVTNYSTFLKHDKDAAKILLDANFRCRQKIKKEYNLDHPVYSDTLQVIRWFPGMDQGPHADDMSDTENKDHLHRSFGSVVYLNDNYEGGHTYYPNFNFEVKPKTGSLAFHPATPDHLHGVTRVSNSIRYTLASFWTFDINMSGFWNSEDFLGQL